MSHPTEIGPVNIGTEYEFTMLELAREVGIAVRGEESVIERKPLPADDPLQRRPDLTKARAVLGFEPRVKLADGLKLTAAYFARRMQEEVS